MLSLRTINAMTEAEFVESFRGIYESSPWVPARAFQSLPFTSAEALLISLRDAVDQATTAEQDALIRAHPDLAGKLARAGGLTGESTREQSRLGLNQLDEAGYAEFDRLNRQYRERFQFPFIICVGLVQNRQQVLDAFLTRINHSPDEERREAIRQIHLIASLRFASSVAGLAPAKIMHTSYQVTLRLPSWLPEFVEQQVSDAFDSRESRMRFVVELSRQNVLQKTGGPFAAAVFERDSGRLIAPGVNIVVPGHTSVAHAETMAFMLAQQRLETFDLGAAHLPAMELFASSQPCIQCFGNTWWSGVQALTIGARAEDVEEITGFKEGPLPSDWVALLENRPPPLRPIAVTRDLLRDHAKSVLELYRETGGFVYNAGSGT